MKNLFIKNNKKFYFFIQIRYLIYWNHFDGNDKQNKSLNR